MGDGDRSSSGHFGPVDLESCAPPGTRLRDQSAAATILARCSPGPRGSLYPALHRLEHRDVLAADWKETGLAHGQLLPADSEGERNSKRKPRDGAG